MTLVDKLNEKFQQVELPFEAFERDNSIFINNNGYYAETNIHNIEQLENDSLRYVPLSFPVRMINIVVFLSNKKSTYKW